MRTIKHLFSISLLVATILVTGMAHAQEGTDKLDPATRARLETKQMTLALDLTDAQAAQVLKLNEERTRNRAAARKKRKEMRDTRPTPQQRAAYQEQRLDQMIAYKRSMRSLLNDKQYERFEKMMMRKKGKHKNRKRNRNRF